MILTKDITERPLVSVIVPTRNSSYTIATCLESIRAQTYPDIEIIVVDNNSVDNTQKIAEFYGKVLIKGPERSVQRNYGAKNAKGKYLFFVDSDMELTRNVVEECVEKVEKASAVVIPDHISVGKGFWANCRALEKACYIHDDIDPNVEAARFFFKDVFWEMNGYDERVTGIEDWDLSQRVKEAGYKISKAKSFIKHHVGNLTLTKNTMKAFYYEKNSSNYFERHKHLTLKHVVLSRLAYLRDWKRLAREPVHTVGMVFMKFCEFVAATLGYIESKMS